MTPMTVIPTAIVLDRAICENAFLLYAYLAAQVEQDGSGQFPGYERIKTDLGWPKTYHPQTYVCVECGACIAVHDATAILRGES